MGIVIPGENGKFRGLKLDFDIQTWRRNMKVARVIV